MLSENALAVILSQEAWNDPWHFAGGDSGITLGFGYDLGQVKDVQSFVADWGDYLSTATIAKLAAAVGKRGEDAATLAPSLKGITIDEETGSNHFIDVEMPRFEALTCKVFPGVQALPLDAYGALVSLVYNRGPKMDGPRRLQMRAIRDAVPKGDLKAIAALLRDMKSLWKGTSIEKGMWNRREAEAKLVENAK